MKFKLSIGTCIIISLVLVVLGVLFGAVSGFAGERKDVAATLDGENGLMDVLQFRGADGLNLCVVARRHLPENDEDIETIEKLSKELQSGKGTLKQKSEQNGQLDEAISALHKKLKENESFQNSTRDQKYLDMLTTDLSRLSAENAVETYHEAAEKFNEKLTTSVFGKVASFFGVRPCEMYQ